MCTPSPKGYEAYLFLPVAAQKLQQNIISELQKRPQSSEVSSSHLSGKGEPGGGSGLGVPPDHGRLKQNNPLNEDTIPDSASAAQSESEEVFPSKFKRRKIDPDGDMPQTLPPPQASMLQKIVGGINKIATAAVPVLDGGLRLAQHLKGGQEMKPEIKSGENDYPWYVGMYYK